MYVFVLMVLSFGLEDLFEDDVSEAVTGGSHGRACQSVYVVVDRFSGLKATCSVNESCVDILSYHLEQ